MRTPVAGRDTHGWTGDRAVIQKFILAALDADDDIIHEPPERIIDLAVVAGVAHLIIAREPEGPAEASIAVPARSLLRALTAAIEDDEAPKPPGVR